MGYCLLLHGEGGKCDSGIQEVPNEGVRSLHWVKAMPAEVAKGNRNILIKIIIKTAVTTWQGVEMKMLYNCYDFFL